MANLTPVVVDTAGEAVTYASASGGGDVILNASGARLRVKNGAGSPITVTLTGVVTCNQGSTHNKTYTVTNGTEQAILVPPQCVDPTTGSCAVGYSSATSITVAVTA